MRLSAQCFIIMPFGKKEEIGKSIDFDKVYTYIIKKALEQVKEFEINCIRSDEISKAGSIHADMMEHILNDEIAIVDLTTSNPNVFYELGVRHALRKSVTVLIRNKGTVIPFNISGFRVIDYNLEDSKNAEEARNQITDFVVNGLKNRNIDSLVHQVLGGRIAVSNNSKRISNYDVFEFSLRNMPTKKICLITGDILSIKSADIWVNSENTNMKMARFFDRGISSTIRYQGALKDHAGHVIEDIIANELSAVLGHHESVPPATIIVTGSGELEKTHNVKRIFHVAAVEGMVGQGYRPIANIGHCITKVLSKSDSPEFKDTNIKSILFPIIGTGTGRGDPKIIVPELIESAISYLEINPDSSIEKIYFLAHNEDKRDICLNALNQAKGSLISNG